jgi:hypothetical protein
MADRPSVRRLLAMPEAHTLPLGALEAARKIDDGSCYMESPVGAYIISRVGANSTPDQIIAFYRQNFIPRGWKEDRNGEDTFWTIGNSLIIELQFIEPNTTNVIGGAIDTSRYHTWYILSISDSDKTKADC